MSSRNTIILTVVIIAIFLGVFYLVSTVPLIENEPETLESFQSGSNLGAGSLSAGYFIRIPLELDKGKVEFSYSVDSTVNAFIMTTEQYYGYAESLSGYTGSIDAGLDSTRGILTFEITNSDTYYFIIENEHVFSVRINSYEIKQMVKQTILESLRK